MSRGNLVVIVGLPASGKTTLAKSEYPDYLLYDDVSKYRIEPKRIVEELLVGVDCVVIDPHLCRQFVRMAAARIFEGIPKTTKWIFFADDPEQCIKNAKQRLSKEPEKTVVNFIYALSRLYTIPEAEGTIIRPVYKP